MQPIHLIAYEIGSSSIKGAAATLDPATGHLDILAVEKEKLIDKVRYGIVENPADVAACVTSINRRLKQRPGVAPRLITQVYVGISGRSVQASGVTVERSFPSETEITRGIINDLSDRASRTLLDDRKIIAVTPANYEVDGKATREPQGTFAREIKAEMNLISCRNKMVSNLRRVFNERCNLKIASWIVTPLAVALQSLTDEERRLGVALLDCGAETTTVVVFKDAVLRLLVTIPMGSRNITRDLTSLNYLEERAEEIKLAVGNASAATLSSQPIVTDGIDTADINNIVGARADEIISNIINQLEIAGFKPEQLPAGLVVTGGGARLRGFNELLAKLSGMKTRQAAVAPDTTMRAADIAPAENIDLIALLAEAAKHPVECTVMTVSENTQDTVSAPATPAAHNTSHVTQPEDEISRIGTYEDGTDEDLGDDPEPDEEVVNKASQRSDTKTATADKEVKHREEKPKKDAFWKRALKTVTDMMNDEEFINDDVNRPSKKN